MRTLGIHCCACDTEVPARLTKGAEVYPHRPDLAKLPFWKCDLCGNFVGCHHQSDDPTAPLGVIATPELKRARQRVHAVLDPLWRKAPDGTPGPRNRKELYAELGKRLGREYHTADLRTLEEAEQVYQWVCQMAKSCGQGPAAVALRQ